MKTMPDVLTLDDLCRAARVTPQWVRQSVDQGLLPVAGRSVDEWRFDVVVLRRVRVMRQLEVDFDAVPELAALVADLHDEIERLRLTLQRAGG